LSKSMEGCPEFTGRVVERVLGENTERLMRKAERKRLGKEGGERRAKRKRIVDEE
jgi:hypothetical protein